MKKTIKLLSVIALSVFVHGQENPPLQIMKVVGFELNEGYVLGSVNNQQSWKVSNSPIFGYTNSVIVTDELSNNGNNSLKIGFDNYFETHSLIGAHYIFDKLDYRDIEVHLRFSKDEFSEYSLNTINTEYNYFGDLITFRNGSIYIKNWEKFGQEVKADMLYSPDTWYKLNINYNLQEGTVEYKLDDVVLFTRRNVDPLNLGYTKVEFLHNNINDSALMYVDDLFLYESSHLTTLENNKKSRILIYPNPTTDFITIQNIEGRVDQITLGDSSGKNVLHLKPTDRKLNLQGLPKGIYLLKIKTDKGFFIEKIIKK